MELTLKIREIRKAKGLKIGELAEQIGVSEPHLSEVERGLKNVNNHLLTRISEVLGVEPHHLIGAPVDPKWDTLKAKASRLSDDGLDRLARFADDLASSEDHPKVE